MTRTTVIRWVACGATCLAALLTACQSATEPDLPPSAEQFAALPAYSLWWSMVQTCSGRTGNLSAIRFYRASPSDVASQEGGVGDAYWSERSYSIVIRSDAIHAGELVRHEMLHALLRGGDHPRSQFLERCGGVVVCLDACIEAAGPAPDPPAGAQPATPDDVDVSVVIAPAPSEIAQFGGAIAVTVVAHNATTHPIVVALPTSSDAGGPAAFSYRLSFFGFELTRDVRAADASVTTFAAGETKRFVFDFFADAPDLPNGLVPATYQVYGAYGLHWSDAATLTVAP